MPLITTLPFAGLCKTPQSISVKKSYKILISQAIMLYKETMTLTGAVRSTSSPIPSVLAHSSLAARVSLKDVAVPAVVCCSGVEESRF